MSTPRIAAVLLGVFAVAVSGCGSTGDSGRSITTLRVPMQAGVAGGADPDVFYDVEGLQVTNEVYEGLLAYDEKGQLVGDLARRWKVAADGRTYDFTLRPGVRFSDGTAFDAAAMKQSLERRVKVGAGPAYMLAGVKRITAVSPQHLRLQLAKPNAALLDHLASPWGPKAVSPAAIAKHAHGKDMAKGWLAGHSAGTGPYELTESVPGQRFVLRASPTWTRSKPVVREVQLTVVPDPATTVNQLRGGQVDMVTNGLTTGDVEALRKTSGIGVTARPSSLREMMYINTGSSELRDPEVRRALMAFVDRPTLTKTVYSDLATPSTTFYPNGSPLAARSSLNIAFDPTKLKALAKRFHRPLVVEAISGYGPAADQIAQLLQGQLQQAGIRAVTRDIPAAQAYELPTRPKDRPDVLITGSVADDLAPDSYTRIFFRTGGAVNWLGCSVPAADRLIDQAAVTTDEQRRAELGVQAGAAWTDAGCALPLSDLHDVTVARTGVAGLQGTPARPFAVEFEKLIQGN